MVEVGHGTQITGKILRCGYLENRCHGNEKSVFTAQISLEWPEIVSGPSQSIRDQSLSYLLPW